MGNQHRPTVVELLHLLIQPALRVGADVDNIIKDFCPVAIRIRGNRHEFGTGPWYVLCSIP